MQRRGFTLLELMVSVLLLFLMVFFLGRTYSTLKQAAESGQRHERIQNASHGFSQLLVRDFLQANDLNISRGRDFDSVQLKGVKHSLYGRSRSEITYAVLKPQRQLIRLEAQQTIALPVPADRQYQIDSLILPDLLKSFKVYRTQGAKENNSTLGCGVLLFVEFEGGREPLLLEMGLLNHDACKL